LAVDLVEVADDSVVGERAAIGDERVRVGQRSLSGVGIPDMREELRGTHKPCLVSETVIISRERRPFHELELGGRPEGRQSEAIGVGMTLLSQRSGRVEQPERRVDVVGAGMQGEQATDEHSVTVNTSSWQRRCLRLSKQRVTFRVEFSPLPLMPAENHETVQDRILAAPVGKIVKGIFSRSRSALRMRDQLAARRGCR
jgi:hypothetical protein